MLEGRAKAQVFHGKGSTTMHARDADRHKSPRRASDFPDLLSLAPTLAPVAADGRDASIVLTVTPSTLTVNPGESGEYTVRVYNTGSNPVTVQLSASEAQTLSLIHI